ncbi:MULTISPECIES: hypothetical protein [unclassified Arenibacter]|uniref:hypothetical protein n=1 Tax=unclassified Arenibacter TaxID=2615047 RepID=UPI000E349FB3|nr:MULTISPECIES: hypothetical protein [unclassified Arenibacter]MCM4162397.1 hypothetical protein [Arenibacter sp. A80]RFT57992.1 hypothetical protein D0S24_02190 [Arenibacter sp. P308M17]
MKSFSFLLVILLFAGNSTFGQENTISEFDLYGCWKMKLGTNENGIKKRTYISCGISEPKNSEKHSSIVFKAFNKCEFPAVIQDALCPLIYKNVEGTWKYDKKSGIVEIYYPKDFKKEFWDAVKEESPEAEIPNPRMKTKFKIVGFEKWTAGNRIITPNN